MGAGIGSGRMRRELLKALARTERGVFTKPAPKSAGVHVKFHLTQAKGSTKALTERPDVRVAR